MSTLISIKFIHAYQIFSEFVSHFQAMLSLALTLPLVVFISALSMACGLILTALFAECDPMKAKIINDQTQYLPYLGKKTMTRYNSYKIINKMLYILYHVLWSQLSFVDK